VKRARRTGDVNETALDQALHTWPDISRTERDWAEFAGRIEGGAFNRHSRQSTHGGSDEELLSSPLPESLEESHKRAASSGEIRTAAGVDRAGETLREPSRESPSDLEDGIMSHQQSQRGGDRRSFRDLAQMAGTPIVVKRGSTSGLRPKTAASDSGMIDLAALAAADRAAVDRASVTPLASTDLADSEELPTAPRISPTTPSTAFAPAPVTVAVAPARIVSAQAALQVGPAETSSRGRLGLVAAAVGLAAIAAGAFIAVHALRPGQAVVTTSAQAPVVQAAAVAQAPGRATQAPVAAAAPGVDPASLPQASSIVTAAPVEFATRARHSGHALRAHSAPHASSAKTAETDNSDNDSDTDSTPAVAEAAPAPKPEVKVAAKEAPAAPAGPGGGLADMIKQAAAAPIPATPAADPPPVAQALPAPTPAAAPVAAGSVPQRPSQGAVTSALSGVLASARKCLGPDDGVSRAHVVFGSDGNVQSTTVTGPAEGESEEGCIKAALGKAHVPAFAEATYGATVTVRP